MMTMRTTAASSVSPSISTATPNISRGVAVNTWSLDSAAQPEGCASCQGLKAPKPNTCTTIIVADDTEYWKPTPAPDLNALGNGTWQLIHTIGAYMPENPTPQRQKALKDFIHNLAAVFPCSTCSNDFTNLIAQRPPETSSREAFAKWACNAHNDVNRKLGKPEFDCSRLDARWKKTTL